MRNYRKLEVKAEKLVRKFSAEVCRTMGWPKLKISRFKIGNMQQYRGYCMACNTGDIFILVSNNPNVYPEDYTEKDFWNAVVHELIHAYLYRINAKGAFKHGKNFKTVCHEIERVTCGKFTAKEILK